MNAREERGLIIAATCRLNRLPDGTWLVPSQSNRDSIYRVNLEAKTCTCPDHKEGGHTCKHFYAASSAVKRKFGNSVLSKTDAGMVNEVLYKCFCHNITCLIQEQETLGISPVFWKDEVEEDRQGAILPFVQS